MPGKRNPPKRRSASRPSGRRQQRQERPVAAEAGRYSTQDLQRLIDLPASLLRSLTQAGHVRPTKIGNSVSYSFQDLVVLRAAGALRAARIPTRRISAALSQVRDSLPPGANLTAVSLAAAGQEIVIRSGKRAWQPDSGQYQLPLAINPQPAAVRAMPGKRSRSVPVAADAHFARGVELEESDIIAARAAYSAALEADVDHLDSRINLGRLLHLNQELVQAEIVYRAARHASALLSFNLANLLEDLHRDAEAAVAYREALALDPALHDAHFNLSRLYERANEPREALRHLLAYRRHSRERDD